jgi:hypothetical protein
VCEYHHPGKRTIRRRVACAALCAVIAAFSTPRPCRAVADDSVAADAIRRQVVQTLRAQPIGESTIGAADVPDAFLERVADRVIRMDFQRRHRRVATAEPSRIAAAKTELSRPDESTDGIATPKRGVLLITMGAGLALVLAGVVMAVRRRPRAP